jgi:hypothetical protein
VHSEAVRCTIHPLLQIQKIMVDVAENIEAHRLRRCRTKRGVNCTRKSLEDMVSIEMVARINNATLEWDLNEDNGKGEESEHPLQDGR